MDQVKELLKAAAGGPSGLDAFLRDHRLTPELVRGVGNVLAGFLKERRLDQAEFVTGLVAHLWLRLGDRPQGLAWHIDNLQMRFLRAATAESYAEIRKDALGALSKAGETQSSELAFRAAVLAADASYFRHKSRGIRVGFELSILLGDLATAVRCARGASGSEWFPRFVSVFGAVVNTGLSQQPLDPERAQAEQLLRQLAAAAEELIPVSFTFPGEPKKTAQLADLLTRLADQYGR
jgi:hypothetical protein